MRDTSDEIGRVGTAYSLAPGILFQSLQNEECGGEKRNREIECKTDEKIYDDTNLEQLPMSKDTRS